MDEIKFKNIEISHFQAIVELYTSVGWSNYVNCDIEEITKMLEKSTYLIGAFNGNFLIGFVRGLSDGVSIHFIQDILVHPNYQRKGIGKELMISAKLLYPNIHKTVLLTDDESQQTTFYKSLGFLNIKEISPPMNVFIEYKSIA